MGRRHEPAVSGARIQRAARRGQSDSAIASRMSTWLEGKQNPNDLTTASPKITKKSGEFVLPSVCPSWVNTARITGCTDVKGQLPEAEKDLSLRSLWLKLFKNRLCRRGAHPRDAEGADFQQALQGTH